MLARFMTQTTIINNMLFVHGKVYNVEYFKQTDGCFHGMSNEWLWFRVCELDSYDGTILTYYSWDMFYANWQPMEEVPMKCGDNICCPRFTCPRCKMR